MSTQTQSPFVVKISGDRLSATIQTRPNAELAEVTPDNVLAALQDARVVVDDQVTQRAQQYAEALRSPDGPPDGEFELAAGRPMSEAQDGRFVWADSLQKQAADWYEDGAVDFYSLSSIATVKAGTVIGRVTPPVPATEGIDVHGQPLHPLGQCQEVRLRDGVELGADGTTVTATAPGKVVYEHPELGISEAMEIDGDVDSATGNPDATTDVVVHGTVRDLCRVKTTKNLTVWGAVEGAEVDAGGDVAVREGIVNRGKGTVVAGGEIVAKFCDLANLRAQRDVRVVREVVNSQVYTEGKLIAPNGAVLGGRVYARRGVEVHALGGDAGVRTEIAVGLDADEARKIKEAPAKIREQQAGVEKIRNSVGPLMAQLRRLTHEQREKATELLCRAEAIDAEIKELEQEVAALRAKDSAEDGPYVLIAGEIYRGVAISISGRVVTFDKELNGPIRIERRKIKRHTVVAAIDQTSGTVSELNSCEL